MECFCITRRRLFGNVPYVPIFSATIVAPLPETKRPICVKIKMPCLFPLKN